MEADNTHYSLNKGERLVHDRLKRELEAKHFHLLNSITIPTSSGGSTQIDHVVICKGGIYVIEVKHYSGWIFGSANNPKWTQKFGTGKTFTFQNPIRQNYKHIATIIELAKIDKKVIHSRILLTGSAEFKTEKPKELVSIDRLIEEIKYSKPVIEEWQLYQYIGAVEHARYEISNETDVEHVNRLNREHSNINNPASGKNGQAGSISKTSNPKGKIHRFSGSITDRRGKRSRGNDARSTLKLILSAGALIVFGLTMKAYTFYEGKRALEADYAQLVRHLKSVELVLEGERKTSAGFAKEIVRLTNTLKSSGAVILSNKARTYFDVGHVKLERFNAATNSKIYQTNIPEIVGLLDLCIKGFIEHNHTYSRDCNELNIVKLSR